MRRAARASRRGGRVVHRRANARVIEEWREAARRRKVYSGPSGRRARSNEPEGVTRSVGKRAAYAEDAMSRSEDRRKQLFTQLTDACRTDPKLARAGGVPNLCDGIEFTGCAQAHEKAVEAPLGRVSSVAHRSFKRAVGGGAAWVAVVPASEEAANAALRLELAGTLTATFPAVEIVRTLGRTEERLAVDRAARDDLNVQVKRAQSELHAYDNRCCARSESTLGPRASTGA